MKSQALVYHETGKPAEVLRLEERVCPAPGEGELQVALEAAAINPSDLGMIGGSYGRLQKLPAVAGREGVGRVIATGSGVDSSWTGSLVKIPEPAGVWQSHSVFAAADAQRLPEGLDPQQGAMSFVNPPTALRLLRDFVELREGDWIVQNAANSAVGIGVIQLARRRGLRTVNLVRRQELIEPLQALGADLVIVDGDNAVEEALAATPRERIRLGLNSVGGSSVLNLCRMVADGAPVVTFGGMTGEKIRFPTRQLIFNDLQLRGFWMDRWLRNASATEKEALWDEVFSLTLDGTFLTPVAGTFSLENFAEALEMQANPRLGKVLFTAKA